MRNLKLVRRFLGPFLFSLLSCSIILPCLSLHFSNKISSYGIIAAKATNDIKILRKVMFNDYSGKTASWWADHVDVYFGQPSDNSLINQIKAIRPDFIALVYRNCKWARVDKNEYPTFHDNGWIMLTADGHEIKHKSYTDHYLVDLCNPAVRTWLGNKIKSYVDAANWDGVQMDDAWTVEMTEWAGNCKDATTGENLNFNVEPISPYLGHKVTDQEIRDAHILNIAKAREKLGQEKIVQFNGIYRGHDSTGFWQNQAECERLLANSGANCFSSEGAYGQTGKDWYTESQWKECVDFEVWITNNWLDDPPNFGDYSPNYWLPTTYCANPPSGSVEDYARYVFCSTALGMATERVGLRIGEMIHENWAQEMYATNFGYSLGDYYIASGTHVYVKDFSRVKVLVNPTSTSYQVPIEGNYTLDGQPVTSPLTVAPHTGMILVNQNPT